MGKQKPEEAVTEATRYSFDELVSAAHSAFNTQPEVVFAALYNAKVDTATKEEAQAIITEFLEREV